MARSTAGAKSGNFWFQGVSALACGLGKIGYSFLEGFRFFYDIRVR